MKLSRLQARGEANARRPIIRRVSFSFPNLPTSFDGFRILHLSDFHFDGEAARAVMIRDMLRGVESDLCVLTGDYLADYFDPLGRVYCNLATVLSGVRAQYGTVGILGNNDHSEFVQRFSDLGVRMLVNDGFELGIKGESIWIAGVDDPNTFECEDVAGAMRGASSGAFKLLLAHSPEVAREAVEADVHLYVCGHTHGGQMCVPVLGPLFLNASCPRRFGSGAWRYKTMQGYTTTGLGTSAIPARFNCPPEAAIIELRRAR
ncbi:MAG: metallophosphoesterase family protein [Candidatus Hydrogenedentes bacterium]|nr:metallophosphoesterase family protein [Candidatus Hydrogenedentota bacterium]